MKRKKQAVFTADPEAMSAEKRMPGGQVNAGAEKRTPGGQVNAGAEKRTPGGQADAGAKTDLPREDERMQQTPLWGSEEALPGSKREVSEGSGRERESLQEISEDLVKDPESLREVSEDPEETRENPVSHVIGVILCAIILPILVINIIFIVQGILDPDHVPSVLGLSPMIVVTKSMDPTIAGGDMIVVRRTDPGLLEVGDVISFFDPQDSRQRVVTTHRIVEIYEDEAGVRSFLTKGDANNAADPFPVGEDKIVGKYRLKIPYLGQIALFMRTVPGMLLLVVLPILLLIAFDAWERKRAERRRAAEERSPGATPVPQKAILPAGHDAGQI